MASTNLAKATYFLAGTGILAGVGYLVKPWLIGDRIIDLIKVHNPERQLLTKASPSYSNRWKKAWFDYRKANENREVDIWKIGDWKKEGVGKSDTPAPTSFIDACETNSEMRVSGKSDPLYQGVLDWCTGSSKVSISERIREAGKRTLNNYDSKTKEDSGWKPLWKKYLESNKHKEKDALGVKGWTKSTIMTSSGKDEVMEDFIKKCMELSKVEVESTLDVNYEKAINSCSGEIHAEDLVKEQNPKRKLIKLSKLKEPNDPIAVEIWQKYIAKNRDRIQGEDEWKIASWDLKKKQENVIPEGFWDNCINKRKTVIKSVEDKVFDEVKRYCTIEDTRPSEYAEEL